MTHQIRIFDFDGGIHPAENKAQSTQRPIRLAPIPNELVLPLHQHIGAAAKPIVAVGDKVLKGQIIAEAAGFVSVPLHAPTSGEIIAIEPRLVPHASGLSEDCIVIGPDGADRWIERQGLLAQLGVADFTDVPASQLVNHIRNCGIAGMGGAGFPTAVKLNIGQRNIGTLILNGAECEPYITADDMLMRERAHEVVRGAQILLHILNAGQCLIGVEDNKPNAIAALNAALVDLHEEHHIDVVVIPTKYPSGGEKQLIQILTGEEVPAGGIPADLGIVCQNVGTASAIARAVDHGEPLISRITTVTGDAVHSAGNWEVLLGTPAGSLLELADYTVQKRERVIMGGPMMGFALPSLDIPVVKTTNCLLAPSEKELPTNKASMACIRCGMCAEACPADLLPQQLYWFSKAEEFNKAEQHNLFDCIECGACSYVCPSEIPLVQYYRYAKGAVREERAAQAKADQARERFEHRLARQERELAEKETKRKARAEKAAQAQSAKTDAPTGVEGAAGNVAAAPNADLEKLQKQFDATQVAIAKTKEKLEVAKNDPDQADKVALFEAALVKTQDKMKDLAKQLAVAKKAAKAAPAADIDADKGDPNSPDRLKKKWDMAQTRLETAEKRLAEAREQGADTVAALETGVEKQRARVDEAKVAYEKALAAPAASTESQAATATALDADTLAKKILAQTDRLEKAKERLTMAQQKGLDTVDALTMAVNKQQDKLTQLQQQAESAPENP